MRRAVQVAQQVAKLGKKSVQQNITCAVGKDNKSVFPTNMRSLNPYITNGVDPSTTKAKQVLKEHPSTLTARGVSKNRSARVNITNRWNELHKHEIIKNMEEADMRTNTMKPIYAEARQASSYNSSVKDKEKGHTSRNSRMKPVSAEARSDKNVCHVCKPKTIKSIPSEAWQNTSDERITSSAKKLKTLEKYAFKEATKAHKNKSPNICKSEPISIYQLRKEASPTKSPNTRVSNQANIYVANANKNDSKNFKRAPKAQSDTTLVSNPTQQSYCNFINRAKNLGDIRHKTPRQNTEYKNIISPEKFKLQQKLLIW